MRRLGVGMLVMGVAVAVQAAAGQAAPKRAGNGIPATASEQASQAAEALTRGEPLTALSRADEAVRIDPKNAWAHYNRAAALAEMQRVDDALAAFEQAVGLFSDADRYGRSVALWGKAHLLYQSGRCEDAGKTFLDYAKLVERTDPQAAAMARRRSETCRPHK